MLALGSCRLGGRWGGFGLLRHQSFTRVYVYPPSSGTPRGNHFLLSRYAYIYVPALLVSAPFPVLTLSDLSPRGAYLSGERARVLRAAVRGLPLPGAGRSARAGARVVSPSRAGGVVYVPRDARERPPDTRDTRPDPRLISAYSILYLGVLPELLPHAHRITTMAACVHRHRSS